MMCDAKARQHNPCCEIGLRNLTPRHVLGLVLDCIAIWNMTRGEASSVSRAVDSEVPSEKSCDVIAVRPRRRRTSQKSKLKPDPEVLIKGDRRWI
jgi:hypothetical protein